MIVGEKRLGRTIWYVVYLLVVWTIFRWGVRLPEAIEELWFKPVLWLIPLFWLNGWGKDRISFFGKKEGWSLVWGLGLGLVYMVIAGAVAPWSWKWSFETLGVGLATAITENLVFVGYILPVLKASLGQVKALVVTGILFGLIHIPMTLFIYQLEMRVILGLFLMLMSVTVINGWLRLKLGSVVGPVLASWMLIMASLR